MGNTNNRNGPGRLKRMWRKLATMIVAVVVSLSLGTGIAFADLQGIDVSGWQPSDITSRVTADFAIVKTTQALATSTRRRTRRSPTPGRRARRSASTITRAAATATPRPTTS